VLYTHKRRGVAFELVHHRSGKGRPNDGVVVKGRRYQEFLVGAVRKPNDALGVTSQQLTTAVQ
jgi:hypothetical protein